MMRGMRKSVTNNMADVFSKEKRSEIMSKVRSTNTGFEREVFRRLRKLGYNFQKHYRKVPGRPDIAFPRKKIAIFLDGDFWHGWRFSTVERKLSPFWRKKISGNIARDIRNRARLRRQGWRVIRIWQHHLKHKPDLVLRRIEECIKTKGI